MTDISTFLAGIGVNTHVDATTTGYGYVALVQASLAYLGVSLIRDHAYDIDLSAYTSLAAAGVKMDLILDDDPKAELDSLSPIFSALRFVEGPNEVDFQPVLTNGIGDPISAAIAEQSSVFAAVTATPALAGIPIINASLADSSNLAAFAGTLAFATVANLHPYAAFGASPASALADDLNIAKALSRLPVAITETGYYTMPNDDSGVDESVQARLTLDTLFDAAQRGITPTFLYELLDEAADPLNTDPQLHYGLFNADGSPKPVATALHNLTTMLTAANATPGIPPVVSLRLGNAPETAQTMTLTGAAGTTIVAVWAEPPIWDPITHTEIVAPLVQTEIDLGSTVASVQVFDPLAGTKPIASYANVSRLTVAISDHPLLIQLSAAVPVVVPTRPIVTPPSIGETTLPIGATTSEAAGAAVTSAAPPQVPAASTTGVYRFFNTGDGTHFYTASITEAQTVERTRADLVPEGVGLRAIAPDAPDAAAGPVYRFFDSASGTQFLTASTTERDTLIATRTDLRYEPASIFYEHAAAQPGDSAVFRFFDTVHGTHFYTDSAAERAVIITTRADLVAEGIGFYEPPAAS